MIKGLLTIVVALIVVGAGWVWFSAEETKAQKRPAADAGLQAIACLGRIEPEDGVMHLAAPYSVQGPSMIAKLLVVEGQTVASNQVLAVTSNHETLKAEYEMAECQVKVSEYQLVRLKAGEKKGEIAAQKAELDRAEAELRNAERELERHEELRKTGTVALAEFDRARLSVETRRKEMERAREKLSSIEEIRQVDLEPSVHSLKAAAASARRAKAELERSLIRAPVNGQVIKIHAHPGEEVGREGVLEMARTDSMFVIAEVYETDIARVRQGQRAEITGESFTGTLSGTVDEIGMKVGKNEVKKTDPSAYADARVVEVKIRLSESDRVAGLIHAQVQVRVLP